jgi:hypothetical protein
VEEDTHLLDHINLNDHFFPSNKGTELAYRANVVTGRGQVIRDGSTLGFRAGDDFTGHVRVAVTAITPSHTQRTIMWDIEFTPVNDAPRSRIVEPPLVVTFPEDTLRTLDLGTKVYDVDEGDGLTVTFETPEHITIDLDPETLKLTLLGSQDWFGEEQVDLTIMDTAMAKLVLPVRFVVENVADPPVLLQELDRLEVKEDESITISLYDHINDPDGDPLTIHISEDPYVGYQWDAGTGLLTLAPAPDWYGGRILWVTATDPEGHRLQESFWLEVIPVPGPPQIVSVTPEALQVQMREDEAMTFTVQEVFDEESSVIYYHWFVDGSFAGPSISFTYRPGIQDQGAHEVSVVVEDEGGLSDTMVWVVDVEDVPHSPDGGIATPPDGSSFKESDSVPFVAFYYDPDGDDLRYSWYIDGLRVSDEPVFEHRLDAGDHKVTLQVSSDGDSITEELDIVVVEDAGGPSMGIFIAIAILGITGAIGILLVLRRTRG